MEWYLLEVAWSMKPGECLRITRWEFNEAFPHSVIGAMIDGRSPEDRFLEKLPGTNYGAYRLHKDILTGDYTLSRHECGTERLREDWDRRHRWPSVSTNHSRQ
jgi:hypothetical protein